MLIRAVLGRDTELIEYGADLEKIDLSKKTALVHAIEQSNTRCVKILIDSEVNLYSTNRPILNWILYDHRLYTKYDMVEFLLSNGIDTDLMYGGRTILMHLCFDRRIHDVPMKTLTMITNLILLCQTLEDGPHMIIMLNTLNIQNAKI